MILKLASDGRMFQNAGDLPKVDRPRTTSELTPVGHRAICPRCLWLGPEHRYTDPDCHDLTDTADSAELDYANHRDPKAPECPAVVLVRFDLAGYALMVQMFDQLAPMLTAASAMLDPDAVTTFGQAIAAFRDGQIFPAPDELDDDELDDDEPRHDHDDRRICQAIGCPYGDH